VRSLQPPLDYASYDQQWQRVARAGYRALNLDAWAAGRRYLSLASICLTDPEARALRRLTEAFASLLDQAVDGVLDDPDWWSALAWPWPALELARQEPPHPGRRCTLYGRFDWLLDSDSHWQLIEYNADTPSGGREASALEPALARLQPHARGLSRNLGRNLTHTMTERIAQHPRPVRRLGVVSSHSWLEDLSQATWLAGLLRAAGVNAQVGDVSNLEARRDGRISLCGEPIDALYRFFPVERLYRYPIFASLCEAAIDGRLLLLNGLRGFLAQSKACLAWLWTHRARLDATPRALVEQHLPPTFLARDPRAPQELSRSVVKHVNGREGDSVVFGATLDTAGWEARLLEGGYVVQHEVDSPGVLDVDVDDWHRRVTCVEPRYACVGSFAIGGRFGGCYTRLDGPITSARATYVATLIEPRAAR
jgi:glutathionylspermidine synthase